MQDDGFDSDHINPDHSLYIQGSAQHWDRQQTWRACDAEVSFSPELTQLWQLNPNYTERLARDPPPDRQLRLAQILLSQAKRVGVLYDNHSEFLLNEVRQAAQPPRLEIVTERWDNTNDSRPLQTLLRNSDVLLALDDPDLYNPKTAKNLRHSSYAWQTALIGPNAGFIKAGSLTSSYSDQSDWLAILDELLNQPPTTWPRTHYANRLKVLSNPQVARSLGIEQINEALVATQLAEGESRP